MHQDITINQSEIKIDLTLYEQKIVLEHRVSSIQNNFTSSSDHINIRIIVTPDYIYNTKRDLESSNGLELMKFYEDLKESNNYKIKKKNGEENLEKKIIILGRDCLLIARGQIKNVTVRKEYQRRSDLTGASECIFRIVTDEYSLVHDAGVMRRYLLDGVIEDIEKGAN